MLFIFDCLTLPYIVEAVAAVRDLVNSSSRIRGELDDWKLTCFLITGVKKCNAFFNFGFESGDLPKLINFGVTPPIPIVSSASFIFLGLELLVFPVWFKNKPGLRVELVSDPRIEFEDCVMICG
jgi:hypothetical protein